MATDAAINEPLDVDFVVCHIPTEEETRQTEAYIAMVKLWPLVEKALRIGQLHCDDRAWHEWASRWLDKTDRTEDSAREVQEQVEPMSFPWLAAETAEWAAKIPRAVSKEQRSVWEWYARQNAEAVLRAGKATEKKVTISSVRQYREMILVKFALKKDDPPKFYALSEKAYDNWVIGEPPEGYHLFEDLGSIQVEVV